jgi:hypothetical protein
MGAMYCSLKLRAWGYKKRSADPQQRVPTGPPWRPFNAEIEVRREILRNEPNLDQAGVETLRKQSQFWLHLT